MTAAVLKHHQLGARVLIVVASGEALPGTIDARVANVHADETSYRLDVVSDDGRLWCGCHPDCILPLDSPEVAA